MPRIQLGIAWLMPFSAVSNPPGTAFQEDPRDGGEISSPMSRHQTVYKLRNHPERAFHIDASVAQAGPGGATITAQVTEEGKKPFTFQVEFEGEFTSTKEGFDGEMYLHTAISVMQSQIESHQHRSTLLRVHRGSGLIDTRPLQD